MKFLYLAAFTFLSLHASAQDQPRAYLMEAIKIMKENSVNKGKIDWDALTGEALDSLSGKTTIKQARTVVEQVVKKLGDSHSRFVPEEVVRAYTKTYEEQAMPFPYAADSFVLKQQIAYISLPAIGNLNNEDWKRYVNAFYQKVQKLEAQQPKAWMIDVRDNDGGMLVPMLKAVAPFLDTRNVIGSKDNSGQINYYNIKGADVTFGKRVIGSIAVPVMQLKHKHTPVYILAGKKTSSSGEFIVAAFVGQQHAKILGTPTQGLTSDNSDFRLSDGSIIILTTGTLTDRNGKLYDQLGAGIQPDIKTSGSELGDYIEAISSN